MRIRRSTTALLTCSIALASWGFTSPATAADEAPEPSSEIQQLLEDDPTANLDGDGFLYYVDPAPKQPAGPVQPQRSEGTTTSQAGLAIPALSSRPSSTHTIYLDFDGVALPGSSGWSNPGAGQSGITAGTYGGFWLSSDTAPDFVQAEIDYIQKVWRIVSEKYAPFDVNVTTVDPGQEALTRTNVNDTAYGVQVVVTNDASPVTQICNNQCAGIAYNDLFDGWYPGEPAPYYTADHTIAWVFSSKTFNSPQVTANDAAHEIGHTLGLNHDGSSTQSYYPGHANWVPIMGITNQLAVAQFSKGEYANANNLQDDLAVIGQNGNNHTLGSMILADDYTVSSGAPTGPAALGNQTSYLVDGVISDATDDDLFSISRTCTNPLTATATGIKAGQGVDLEVEILSAGGTVLASNDPASGQTFVSGASNAYEPTGMDATASLASTTSGTTYRVRVDGVGSANPLSSGYTDYGSIGRYQLEISGCPAVATTVPGAPATASATPTVRTSTGMVSWTAPASDGGSAVTGYTITGLPGGDVQVGNVLTYGATNLVPGTPYTVTVFAKNANGTSATGAGTTLKVDTWSPTTKPGLTATLSGSTANLTWTAPANPGGADLTGWRVIGTGASLVDETLSAAPLSASFPVAYGTTSFTVKGLYSATDNTGVVFSDAQSVTRATTTPGAPASASTTPAVKGFTGTVSWTAPAANGGSSVTGYKVTGLPGGDVELGNVLTYEAGNLVPGVTYNLTISAKNTNGYGAARATSIRVATWAPTTKPGLTVTRSGTTATLTFTAPANPGKATLTGWFVDRTGPGASPADKTVTTSSTTMTGLAVGTQRFTARPTYTADDASGVLTSDPKTVVVTAKPTAPKIGTATSGGKGGKKNATAKWAAPSSNGGAAITSYKVVAYKVSGGKVTKTYTSKALAGSTRSLVFALPAGSYKFRVMAFNAVGASPWSAYSKIVKSR